jgi:hypothetical protein
MQIDIKTLARAGAQVRLAELAAEVSALLRAFPGLDATRGGQASTLVDGDGHRLGRRSMSAAEKKAFSVRMKRYWASRRDQRATASTGLVTAKASPKRTMSAAARAKISAAQKRRWAAQKSGTKKR